MSFAHLHVHSEFSLLDGLGSPKKLVTQAHKLGQPALALTDHGTMHGAVEFFRAAKDVGIKPIIGMEAYQEKYGNVMGSKAGRNNYHLLLLAQDNIGYKNLVRISSLASTVGQYYRPRIDHEHLAQYSSGLIATTGCLGAEIPQLIMDKDYAGAYRAMSWYVDVFGKDNFFVELQPHNIPELKVVNPYLLRLSKQFGVGMIATTDVHYVAEGDADIHDTLLCVQTRSKKLQDERMRFSTDSFFMMTAEQVQQKFLPMMDLPTSALHNTLLIAEMCNVNPEDKSYHFPVLKIPSGYNNYEEWLFDESTKGMNRRYGIPSEKHWQRRDHELKIINQMGFDGYFLIVKDICDYARSIGLIWNVRGSGAGSIVAYALGITDIEPLSNGLVFERFLNPDRVSMPDFDLDFPDVHRSRMIEYCMNKYGSDHVAQIVTFGRMKARASFRDVARVLDVPSEEANRLAKLIPFNPSNPSTIEDALNPESEHYSPELATEMEKHNYVKTILDTAIQLEGTARHKGVHAAAVVITDLPVSEYVPIASGNDTTTTDIVAQYEYPILESIGLLKVDFLGLSTLTVIQKALESIRQNHSVELRYEDIPLDDEETFKLLSSGETTGLFQVESVGMRQILTKMQPRNLSHITAVVSLYRPGPMEFIDRFLDRMHGREEVAYLHPSLEPILAETYGIIVYQEQIIQILNQLAGYSPGAADLVRRAISKKKESDILAHRDIFIAGCAKNGISEDISSKIYSEIEYFARYGFNKAHGADYAALTIKTAYLKAHYPIEYMMALLVVERDKTDKVVSYIHEARRMGIDVLLPDINESDVDFTVTQTQHNLVPTTNYDFQIPKGSAIRYGLGAIKGVGAKTIQGVIEERAKALFKNVEDFIHRTSQRRNVISALIQSGAMDSFGDRGMLHGSMEILIDRADFLATKAKTGYAMIWEDPEIVFAGESVSEMTKLMWEKDLLGVYVSGHPVSLVEDYIRCYQPTSCLEVNEDMVDEDVVVFGIINDKKMLTTKSGERMCFLELEDTTGTVNITVFPTVYLENRLHMKEGTIVGIRGSVNEYNGRYSVVANELIRKGVKWLSTNSSVTSSPSKKRLGDKR